MYRRIKSARLRGEGKTTVSPTPAPQTTRTAYLTVDWAARSRGIGAPSSALSAKFVVKDAKPGGGGVVYYAERPEGIAASSKQYQTTEGVVTGKRRIEATFYGATNAVGAIVATASATVDINGNDGTIAQSISVSKSVASVEVTSGQRLSVGDQRFAAYTAKDASGNVVAVPPGSAFFTSDNAGIVRASSEIVEAVTSGTANITATVDGVASAPTAVSVLAPVTVTVVGNPTDSVVQAVKDTLTQRKIPFVAYNDIPTPEQLQANDILMVCGSFVQDTFLGTDDAPRIEAYLATGRGVVLLNDAPAHLSGEHQWNDEEDVSTTPISRWFGGVQQMSNESRYYYRFAYIKGSLTPRFPYPATT